MEKYPAKEKTLHDGYLYLREATYIQPGVNRKPVEKTIEYFGRGDSVAALIFDKDRNQFVLVRQYRYPARKDDGNILEIVAGGIESETPEESMRREVLEEIGYEVQDFELIAKMYVSPGRTDERLYVYYCEVDSSMKIQEGGGLISENEDIEIVYLSVEEAETMLFNQEFIDAKTILSLQYFFLSKLELHTKFLSDYYRL